MAQTWTTVICVTLAFLSGASSVKLLIGRWNGIVQWHDTETQESRVIAYDTNVSSLDYHYAKGYVYYAANDGIKRRSIDLYIIDLKVIVPDRDVYGIAVDWINNNIYWTRSKDVVLVKSDLEGKNTIFLHQKHTLDNVKGLSNINYLYGIQVDPYERTLFMIAGNDRFKSSGTLVKTDLDGKDLKLITEKKYDTISTFTINRPQKILYIVNIGQQGMYSCKYNGEVIEEFSVCPKITWINPFAVFRQNMYMAYNFDDDRKWDTLQVQPLSSVKCASTPVKEDQYLRYGKILDIKVYDIEVQQPLNIYSSSERIKQRFRNWDECSLLSTEWETIDCLEWECSLKTGNNKSTSSVKLLIGRSNGIIQYHDTETHKTKVIVNDSIVRSLDYHYSKGYIYYSGMSVMRRSFDFNINDLKEISDDRNVYGIAVDWIGNNLYWTRSYDVEVVKADLDGNEQTSIITQSSLEHLRGLSNINYLYNIEVDPYERTLFMIAGSEGLRFMGSLVKSDLEGRNLSVIISNEYKYIAAFTIDRPRKILYIVNMGHRGIYSCRYNGEIIEEFSVCSKMWGIYPFAMFRKNMYMAYGYEEHGNNNIFYSGQLASVSCPIDSLKSDNIILGIKVYSIDVQKPLNVSYSYRPIKQRFSNWNKCSWLTTEWERLDCLKRNSLETAASKRSRYISHDDKRQN